MADKGKARASSPPTGMQTDRKKRKVGDTGGDSGQPDPFLEFTESEIRHILDQAGNVVMGEGQSARVWAGLIPDGLRHGLAAQQVGVKEYNITKHDTFNLWEIEREHLMKLNHPNIVKLIGYCHHKPPSGEEKKVLVLELIPGGTLHHRIFDTKRWEGMPIEWDKRVDILHDVAKAMKYLHEKNLIHRDLKAENILLDSNMNAKLVDFGATIDGPRPPNTFIRTPEPMGTLGYTDPSYERKGRANIRIDIYSFGVLMLVVLLGRKAYKEGKDDLAVKINGKYKNRTLDFLLSKKLRRSPYHPKELPSLIGLARRCLGKASKRPSDDEILKEFQDIQAARPAQPSAFLLMVGSIAKGFSD